MAVTLDAAQSDHYERIAQNNDYIIAGGTYVLPLAEEAPTDPTELQNWKPFVAVNAHAPYRLRRFTYDAKKHRNPPVMPAPVDQGAYTFLAGTFAVPHPAFQPDGSFLWSGTASYIFAEGCAHNAQTGFVVGMTLDAVQQQLDNQAYQNYSDAPQTIREGGVGPKAGWGLAKTIDLSDRNWAYSEPSYFPAQLLSAELVSGPTAYPTISGGGAISFGGG